MEWRTQPITWGYYYFAKNPKDWDISIIVAVSMMQTPLTSWFEARIDGETFDTKSEYFEGGIWLGPLPSIVKPTEEFLKQFDKPA